MSNIGILYTTKGDICNRWHLVLVTAHTKEPLFMY